MAKRRASPDSTPKRRVPPQGGSGATTSSNFITGPAGITFNGLGLGTTPGITVEIPQNLEPGQIALSQTLRLDLAPDPGLVPAKIIGPSILVNGAPVVPWASLGKPLLVDVSGQMEPCLLLLAFWTEPWDMARAGVLADRLRDDGHEKAAAALANYNPLFAAWMRSLANSPADRNRWPLWGAWWEGYLVRCFGDWRSPVTPE